MKISHLFTKSPYGEIIALIAGALLPFSFAPFYWFPLSILAVALLIATWLNVGRKRAFLRGFLFGLSSFGIGVSWVFISIHRFGQASPLLAVGVTLLFIAVLSLFPAFKGYLLKRFFYKINKANLFCALPAIWVLLDWMRSWLFTGFPWLQVGYSQTDYSPLRGLAPIFSIYGITYAILFSSVLIVFALMGNKKRRITCAIVFASIWLISGILCFIPWTHPVGKPIPVTLIQGNAPQSMKWDPQGVKNAMHTYQSLTEKHWQKGGIIVWPETAVPLPSDMAQLYLTRLAIQAKQHDSAVIFGILASMANPNEFYNALKVIGKGSGVYYKRRLVPFGEYLPFKGFLQHILNFFHLPVAGGLKRGPMNQLNPNAQGVTFAAYICYEIAFPEQVRNFLGKGKFITVLSDDTWFGDSFAPAQHMQMAQMRALETGRDVILSTNSGDTVVINADGHVIASTPAFTTSVLSSHIQPMAGYTPWLILGMNTILLAALILLTIAVRRRIFENRDAN
jgi:apolipoprotein N-acyltransferase